MRSGLLAALAGLLIAAPGASAAWSPPFDVSAPEGGARPQVSVDPAGIATVVWEGDGGANVIVRARRIDADGARGPVLTISDPAAFGYEPQVAVDADGDATVVWEGDGVVHVRRITASGALGDIEDVSPVGEEGRAPQVAVDPSGNAMVIWNRPNAASFSYTIEGRRIDATGALGPVMELSGPNASPAGYRVASDPLGNSYALWSAGGVIQRRQVIAGGGLAPVFDVSAAGDEASRPQVAVDPSGLPIAAWQRSDGTVQFRRGGRPIIDLSAPESFLPELAVDPAGNATVVWIRYDGANQRAELRRITANGTLGETHDLWSGGDDEQARVGVDERGDATVVWVNFNGSGEGVIRSRTVSAAGQRGDSVDLSPVEQEVATPALATDPAGNSTAVWSRFDDPEYQIVGARFTSPPPPLGPPAALPAPLPAPPASMTVPAPVPVASATCPTVTLKKFRGYTAGQPKSRRTRTKGVGTKLTLNRAARLRVVSATLLYQRRTVKLRTRQLTTGKQTTLRFAVPRRLRLGTRVTVVLRLRARSTAAGCDFGKPRTFRVRTRVIWVTR
jgi:hypothetical protein